MDTQPSSVRIPFVSGAPREFSTAESTSSNSVVGISNATTSLESTSNDLDQSYCSSLWSSFSSVLSSFWSWLTALFYGQSTSTSSGSVAVSESAREEIIDPFAITDFAGELKKQGQRLIGEQWNERNLRLIEGQMPPGACMQNVSSSPTWKMATVVTLDGHFLTILPFSVTKQDISISRLRAQEGIATRIEAKKAVITSHSALNIFTIFLRPADGLINENKFILSSLAANYSDEYADSTLLSTRVLTKDEVEAWIAQRFSEDATSDTRNAVTGFFFPYRV